MELLLNLAWLLLALPAFHLWRCSRSGARANRFGSMQGLLALGCLLAVLFPVVSATDDLHAMRAEMEESPTSKRSVRAHAGDKCPQWNGRFQNPAGLWAILALLIPAPDYPNQLEVAHYPHSSTNSLPVAGRSPPHPRVA